MKRKLLRAIGYSLLFPLAALMATVTVNGIRYFVSYVDLKGISAPANPASGDLRFYANSNSGQVACLDSTGASCLIVGTTNIAPGKAKISSASVLLINDGCTSGDPCNIGQTTFTGSATATITAGSGSGTARVYKCGTLTSTGCPSANILVVSHPTAAGLTINCVSCTQIQVASPSFPTGSVALYTATITTGAWTALSDLRVFLTTGTGSAAFVQYTNYKGGVCQNTTAGLGFSSPTTNPAVAACVTGTNTQQGVAQFTDASNLSVQDRFYLPLDWAGSIDAIVKWRTSATSGDVVWQLATACVASGESIDPSFNAASTVTSTASGTTNRLVLATIEAVTVTGCAAGEELYFKFFRDAAHASDNLAATAELISLTFAIGKGL
jgi:hypothetical protein